VSQEQRQQQQREEDTDNNTVSTANQTRAEVSYSCNRRTTYIQGTD